MRSFGKLALMGVAALLVCAFVASSALAVTATSPAGTVLAVGSAVKGTSTSAKLTGSFFGITSTTTCHSTVTGTLKANPSANGNIWGTIDSLSFTNCRRADGTSCTVPTPANLPWVPTTGANGNEGGLEVTSTTAGKVGTGTTGTIDLTNCTNTGFGCTLKGLNSTMVTDGVFALTNWVSATWNNTNSTLSINSSVGTSAPASCTATSTNWTAAYTLSTDDAAATPIVLD